jgi:hypothetical protein
MQNDERKEIMDKRSSLRAWRERGGKVTNKGGLIGAAVIILLLAVIIVSSFWNNVEGNSTMPVEKPKNTPVSTPQKNPVSTFATLPAPSITIYSPENITYNTSTPPLNFIVAGSNLDSVMVSVDGGPNITIPHDGTMAKIDFARLNPLFIDDFSGTTKGKWKESSNWRVEGGKYITEGGTSAFGDEEWDNYIIEAKTKINSGKDVSIDMRWDGKSNNYRVQTYDAYGNFQLHKFDDKGYTNLFSTKLSINDPAAWHTWKIAANDSRIQASIDDNQYIDYKDEDKTYLKGKSLLRVMSANVEYDHIQVYRPLSDGSHKLTIFSNNTAGNASSRTVFFTINSKTETAVAEKIGIPVVKNGLEITVKSVTQSVQFTNVWLSVKNIEDKEKPFKIGTGTVIIDNMNKQYENIKVPRSAEIAQTNLYPQAIRDGAIFFERLKEGTIPSKLILYVNGDKLEFMLGPNNK